MRDRPIPFIGALIRRILHEVEHPGTGKSQTRRILDLASDEPPAFIMDGRVMARDEDDRPYRWPRTHAVGDRLYVREAWHAARSLDRTPPRNIPRDADIEYAATARNYAEIGLKGKLRPGMFLPRWASRLTLIVTEVRLQRLQDISKADAIAEGVVRQDPTPEDEEWNRRWAKEQCVDPEPMRPVWLAPGTKAGFGPRANEPQWGPTPEFAFRLLWDSINTAPRPGWASNPWVIAYTFRPILKNIDDVRGVQ